jgi:hypothetical protein
VLGFAVGLGEVVAGGEACRGVWRQEIGLVLCWPAVVFAFRGGRWAAVVRSGLESQGVDAVEGGDEVGAPWPVGGDAEAGSSSAARDDAGGV